MLDTLLLHMFYSSVGQKSYVITGLKSSGWLSCISFWDTRGKPISLLFFSQFLKIIHILWLMTTFNLQTRNDWSSFLTVNYFNIDSPVPFFHLWGHLWSHDLHPLIIQENLPILGSFDYKHNSVYKVNSPWHVT